MPSFQDQFRSVISLSKDQEKELSKLIRIKKLKAGEDFISAGEYPTAIAFVVSGLFRYYYTNEKGEEFTIGFFQENSILSSYSAMIEGRGSYFAIQALENSEIEVVDYLKLQELMKEDLSWVHYELTLVRKGFIAKENREREFLIFDAETRYRLFLERYPRLENRIKQHTIASYLGIAPESLSRLRKNMSTLT